MFLKANMSVADRPLASTPDLTQSAAQSYTPPAWSRWLDSGIFFFLALFSILLPHSIKGGEHAWKIAFFLWLVKLVVRRERPWNQPLTLPLLAYVGLSAVSTALSSDPMLSWDRMKIVCLVLTGITFAQNLYRLEQVRRLMFFLMLSALAVAGFTAWQYTYGVGVQLVNTPPVPLHQRGFLEKDILTRIDGVSVHSPSQLRRVVLSAEPGKSFEVDFLRSFPFHKMRNSATREDFLASGLADNSLRLRRGHPLRAQGTLGHYVVLAEMLMQLGCVAWALLLSATPKQRTTQVMMALIFLSISAALIATGTRAAMAGMALGCLTALLMLARRRSQYWALAIVVVLVLAATLWVRHSRGLNWVDRTDSGTQFRVLMWEDGVRLVKQHPWFGVGMETVRTHWQDWNIRGFAQFHVVSHFHSTPLQIAVERGLLTLAAWTWFAIAYLVYLFRLAQRCRVQSRFATGVVAGILSSFIGFLTTSFVHYNLGEEPVVLAVFFFFGIAVAIDRMCRQPNCMDVE